MNRVEFAAVMAYVGAACGKDLSDDAINVYFDMLSDLPLDAFRSGAQRALVEHRYPTFPSIALLRDCATQSTQAMTPGEAWGLAWKAAGEIDPYATEQMGDKRMMPEKVLARLPPLVADAMRAFGIVAMCYAEKPEVARAQWLTIYSGLSARKQRTRLLPAWLSNKLAEIGVEKPERAALPGTVERSVLKIGAKSA